MKPKVRNTVTDIENRLLDVLERVESQLQPKRPIFRHTDTIPTSIRLDKPLYDAAAHYAKAMKSISGGSLSGLIEYLVWRELGCDSRYTVEPEPGEANTAADSELDTGN